jgi:hypothetical protein
MRNRRTTSRLAVDGLAVVASVNAWGVISIRARMNRSKWKALGSSDRSFPRAVQVEENMRIAVGKGTVSEVAGRQPLATSRNVQNAYPPGQLAVPQGGSPTLKRFLTRPRKIFSQALGKVLSTNRPRLKQLWKELAKNFVGLVAGAVGAVAAGAIGRMSKGQAPPTNRSQPMTLRARVLTMIWRMTKRRIAFGIAAGRPEGI